MRRSGTASGPLNGTLDVLVTTTPKVQLLSPRRHWPSGVLAMASSGCGLLLGHGAAGTTISTTLRQQMFTPGPMPVTDASRPTASNTSVVPGLAPATFHDRAPPPCGTICIAGVAVTPGVVDTKETWRPAICGPNFMV